MAISVSRVKRPTVPGAERRSVVNVTLDAAYATGGYDLPAEDLGLRVVEFAQCQIVTPSSEDPVDGAALVDGKLICFIDGVQVANSATNDLTGAVVQVVAVGKP